MLLTLTVNSFDIDFIHTSLTFLRFELVLLSVNSRSNRSILSTGHQARLVFALSKNWDRPEMSQTSVTVGTGGILVSELHSESLIAVT